MQHRLARLVRGGFATLLLACASAPALAQAPTTSTKLLVRPGDTVVLGGPAVCVKPVASSAGTVEIVKTADPVPKSFAIYQVPNDLTADAQVTIVTGTKDADKTCEGAATRQFTIGIDRTPQVSDDALKKSFNILLSAFVIALLLESAFALLFNWRLFHEFLVGKAWRTPIMFAGALIVVRAFDLDLMASLFDAYNPRPDGAATKATFFTSALTAAILAGGSVGVNRILVGLGFRSQLRPEAEQPKLDATEAWMAVRVEGLPEGFRLEVDEIATPPAGTPTIVGIARPREFAQRLKELLFPSRSRVPSSGGRKVSTERAYEIKVVDLAGKTYDTTGQEITTANPVRAVKFGSRAIVDFDVTIR